MNTLFVMLAAVTLSTAALADEAARPAAAANEGGTPLMVSFTDLKWTELPERKGMKFAVLSGDRPTAATRPPTNKTTIASNLRRTI